MSKSLSERLKDLMQNNKHKCIDTKPTFVTSNPVTISNPVGAMWLKLKEKALAENNEVGDKMLKLIAEVEVEFEKEVIKIHNERYQRGCEW